MSAKFFALFIFLLIISIDGKSQEAITLSKISSPIVLDGIANELAWDEIPYFDPIQYEPVFMGEMNEVTKFKVGYDQNFVYVLGELFTEDPSTITTNSLARDKYSSDDVFAIIIDGFNDNQNASWFFTNPDGVRFDFAVSNDANTGSGRNSINDSWNTFWDVETSQTEEGWFVEMRIPFSSIGVQVNENNITEMGIIVYRWITNKNERHIYPAIPPNWSLGNAKPSQAQDVRLDGVKSKNPLYVTPYALTGVSRISALNDAETTYNYEDEGQAEIGFDLKYNVTSNLTLDVTVNTDFAQVEADDQQLNLSRFNIFFPEKRQFFQQRSGLFDFSFGGDRVFYSRRIGLDGGGNPVRILGGGRLTGRIGNTDIGAINLQTSDSDDLNSENFGVFRLKQQVLNEQSFVGGIFTSRVGTDGTSNFVYGIDSDINLVGENFFEVRASQSIDNQLADSLDSSLGETSAFRMSLRNSTRTGLSYQATFTRLSDNYDPGLGFIRVGGTSQKFLNIGYGRLSKEESIFQRNRISAFYFARFYNNEYEFLNFEDAIQSRTLSIQWQSQFKLLGNLSVSIRDNKEDIPVGDGFNVLGRIEVPSNVYDTYRARLNYSFSEAWKVGGGLNGSFGTFYDGEIKEFSVNPRFFLSRKLEIGGSYRITNLNFPTNATRIDSTGNENAILRSQTDFTSHLGQVRTQYSFNKKASMSAFVQYSNVNELVGANLRFRYNFSEGRDFWIVFNEQVNTNRNQFNNGLPDLPYIQSGSILIKYNHTFVF